MSLAPPPAPGSDNAPARTGGDNSFSRQTSENLFASSYDLNSSASPGFGRADGPKADEEKTVNEGLAKSPYSSVFTAPGEAAPPTDVAPTAPVDGAPKVTDGKVAKNSSDRSTETPDAPTRSDAPPPSDARLTRHSTPPAEPARMDMARSSGPGDC